MLLPRLVTPLQRRCYAVAKPLLWREPLATPHQVALIHSSFISVCVLRSRSSRSSWANAWASFASGRMQPSRVGHRYGVACGGAYLQCEVLLLRACALKVLLASRSMGPQYVTPYTSMDVGKHGSRPFKQAMFMALGEFSSDCSFLNCSFPCVFPCGWACFCSPVLACASVGLQALDVRLQFNEAQVLRDNADLIKVCIHPLKKVQFQCSLFFKRCHPSMCTAAITTMRSETQASCGTEVRHAWARPTAPLSS